MPMTQPERYAAADRLQRAVIPLKKHYPAGWRDFRDPMPPTWRAGLFLKIPETLPLLPSQVPDPSATLRFKAMFGGIAITAEAASLVSEIIGRPVNVIPPHKECVMMDDSEYNLTVPYWTITFDIPESEVCW